MTTEETPIVRLNAVDWQSPEDFYRDLLAALGAPEWHGMCIPALLDTMLVGDTNALNPPMTILIDNLARKPHRVRSEVRAFVDAMGKVPGVTVNVNRLHWRH